LKREPLFQGVADVLERCLERSQAGEAPSGLAVERIGAPRRPATVSLTDARRAAADFVFLHTTRSSLDRLLALLDLTPLPCRLPLGCVREGRPVLTARSSIGDTLLVHDETYRPRLEVRLDATGGYLQRANQEWPAGGLLLVAVEEVPVGETVRLRFREQT